MENENGRTYLLNTNKNILTRIAPLIKIFCTNSRTVYKKLQNGYRNA